MGSAALLALGSSQSYPQNSRTIPSAIIKTDSDLERLILLSIIQAAGWPIWPLILCSIVAVAIILERLYALRSTKVLPDDALAKAIDSTRQGFPSDATIQELALMGAVGPVFAAGLQTLSINPAASHQDVRESMEMEGRMAAQGLERYLTALATLASAAPLLGLLGTVIGMIELFGIQAPGQQQPVELANGISIALYNTALGLLVAIPCLMAWRFFKSRVDRLVLQMEWAAERFARHLAAMRD
jgi:biopolymer transport protein ExbB